MRVLTQRAKLREDVETLLAELGGTAWEVAGSLRSMGVRVGISTPDDSPAARYLHAVLGADYRVKQVRVTKRSVVLRTHRRWRSTMRLRLPSPVRVYSGLVCKPTTGEGADAPFEGNQA